MKAEAIDDVVLAPKKTAAHIADNVTFSTSTAKRHPQQESPCTDRLTPREI